MREQFQKGADVYSSDGQKIGSISDIGPNYLHVSTGFLGLGRDLFIPFDAVSRAERDSVYLNVAKDRVDQMGWDRRPEERAAAAGRGEFYGPTPAAPAAPTAPAERREGYMMAHELPGRTLVSSDGSEIGQISDVGANYAHVSTGILGMGRDYYVPFDAIDYCTRDRCFLNVTIERARTMGWDKKPEERAGMAPAERGFPTEAERGVRRIPLRAEELEVHKHREQVGEVVISKHVVEEKRTIEVPVTHEEVTVERRDIPDQPTEQAPSEEGEVYRVPIYEERVDVEKHPVVDEELLVSKEEVTRQERETGTVRREVPEVETTGEAQRLTHEEGVEAEERARLERERMERERLERERREGR